MKFLNLFVILAILLDCQDINAQSRGSFPNLASARSLDLLLHEYAFRAFISPRTGVIYDGHAPLNQTGLKISVVRLRSGSLRTRGMMSYKEFEIPNGVNVEPHFARVAFVYQNLGNWSSVYYPLLDYTYVTPVLGLLAYNAMNLSDTGLQELNVKTFGSPILINFTDVIGVHSGLLMQCVWFKLDGFTEFRDMASRNVCSSEGQGHFAIAVNSTGLAPAPAPSGVVTPAPSGVVTPAPSGVVTPGTTSGKGHRSLSKKWKIVGSVVAGIVLLVLMAMLMTCLIRYRQKRKMSGMERRADVGETLRMSRVGNAQGPVASGTRTQPLIENEYVP